MEQWREEVIKHYNHNHDALGRFTSGPGGPLTPKQQKQNYKTLKKTAKRSGMSSDIERQIEERINNPKFVNAKNLRKQHHKIDEDKPYENYSKKEKKIKKDYHDAVIREYEDINNIVDDILGKYGDKILYYNGDWPVSGRTFIRSHYYSTLAN